jgi:hypothetical protein
VNWKNAQQSRAFIQNGERGARTGRIGAQDAPFSQHSGEAAPKLTADFLGPRAEASMVL